MLLDIRSLWMGMHQGAVRHGCIALCCLGAHGSGGALEQLLEFWRRRWKPTTEPRVSATFSVMQPPT